MSYGQRTVVDVETIPGNFAFDVQSKRSRVAVSFFTIAATQSFSN
jgi:hypothetical protein